MVLPEKSPAARSMFIDAQARADPQPKKFESWPLVTLGKGASHQTHIPSRCPVSTRCCPPLCLLVYNPMNTLAISPVISPENPTVRWTLLSNLAISLTGGATSLQWMTQQQIRKRSVSTAIFDLRPLESSGIIWVFLKHMTNHTVLCTTSPNIAVVLFVDFTRPLRIPWKYHFQHHFKMFCFTRKSRWNPISKSFLRPNFVGPASQLTISSRAHSLGTLRSKVGSERKTQHFFSSGGPCAFVHVCRSFANFFHMANMW